MCQDRARSCLCREAREILEDLLFGSFWEQKASFDGFEHLHGLDYLRQGISLRAYGQKDPLNEYKIETYRSFEQMLFRFKSMTVFSCLMHFYEVCQVVDNDNQ